jgi:kynureninase
VTTPASLDALREEARARDARDPLARFRSAFAVEDDGLVYLDGNSLGRLPRRADDAARRAVAEWRGRLVRGWNEGWVEAPRRVGEKLARLLGAREGEVLVSDSTSVNLFKLAVAALGARPDRTEIVTDELNFPSDLYVLEGAARLLGGERRVRVVSARDGISIDPGDLADAIGARTALVSLSHASYRSGFLHDLPAVTGIAHAAGALVLWDVSHSAGVVPIDLEASGADLAVGCTYKYLNGGPGAPAFLYVRRALQGALENPITGWFGREAPFSFAPDFVPARGAERFLVGTPPILSLAAAEAGIDLALEAGVGAAREKSVAMGRFLEKCIDEVLAPFGVTLRTPRDAERRGSHLSIGHPQARAIARALVSDENVIPDFRPPDVIRFGFAPLFNSFEDLFEGVTRLRRVLDGELWRRHTGPGLEVP